mgnify:CR=1 FL=1
MWQKYLRFLFWTFFHETFYEKCLEIARLTSDLLGEIRANNNLGLAHARLNDIDTALGFHENQYELTIGGDDNLRSALDDEAKTAGADIVGGDEFIEKIKDGEMNFEKLICTPSMMIKLSKLGKVLGPKGLMPNPKLGTVTENLKTAISGAKSGQAEIRNDKDGNIGVSIGKKSFSDEKLIKNFNAVIDTLEKEKSNNTVKGDLIRTAFITSTMGVSYKLKLGKNI